MESTPSADEGYLGVSSSGWVYFARCPVFRKEEKSQIILTFYTRHLDPVLIRAPWEDCCLTVVDLSDLFGAQCWCGLGK